MDQVCKFVFSFRYRHFATVGIIMSLRGHDDDEAPPQAPAAHHTGVRGLIDKVFHPHSKK
jgi:hypothetical protein